MHCTWLCSLRAAGFYLKFCKKACYFHAGRQALLMLALLRMAVEAATKVRLLLCAAPNQTLHACHTCESCTVGPSKLQDKVSGLMGSPAVFVHCCSYKTMLAAMQQETPTVMLGNHHLPRERHVVTGCAHTISIACSQPVGFCIGMPQNNGIPGMLSFTSFLQDPRRSSSMMVGK